MVPGRGAPGVFPSPLADPDRIRPLGAHSNRDPGAPPGGALGHPAGADRQGAAQSRAVLALGSAAAAAAPAVGDPEQLQPRAAHLGARTWPEPRVARGTLTPEHVPRSPPPGSPVPAPPKVRIRLCAANGGKIICRFLATEQIPRKRRDCLKQAKAPLLAAWMTGYGNFSGAKVLTILAWGVVLVAFESLTDVGLAPSKLK